MKAKFERLDRLEKIFKECAQKASEENALEIWEYTIEKMIKADHKNLYSSWEQLSSFEKQLLTADRWFSFNEFKSLISNEKSD